MDTSPARCGDEPRRVIEAEIVSGPVENGPAAAPSPGKSVFLRALGWIAGLATAAVGAALSLAFTGVFIIAAIALFIFAVAVFAVWKLVFFQRSRRP